MGVQNTTIIPHIFCYRKESKSVVPQKQDSRKECIFLLLHCLSHSEQGYEPTKTLDMNLLLHGFYFEGMQDEILLHPLPPGQQTVLSMSTERRQHLENNQLQSRKRSHMHERNPRSRVSLLFIQCSDSDCCKGSGVEGLEKRCPLTEPQQGCIR